MQPGTKVSGRSRIFQKLAIIHLVLLLFSTPCFSRGDTFAELKRNYTSNNFPGVVRIYNNMKRYDREYRENEGAILVMVARVMAELIQSPTDIPAASNKIQGMLERLLELNHNMTRHDLHIPGKHKEVLLNCFEAAYKGLFGKLVITVNRPAVDIKIDGKYKVTTNRGNEPVEFFLWVGSNQPYKSYNVSLVLDSTKYEEIKPDDVLIIAGKVKHLKFKLKRKPKPKRNIILLSFEYNHGKYGRKIDEEPVELIQPFKDIFSAELGVVFSKKFQISIKYGKNYNVSTGDKWEGKNINESFDYNLTDFEINLVKYNFDRENRHLKFGFRILEIENVDYWENKLNSIYYLVSGGGLTNTRSNKRSAFFLQVEAGYILGISKIELHDSEYGRISPTYLCAGIYGSAELSYSFGGRFDVTMGASYELLANSILLKKYDWLPNKPDDRISLSKIFTRITFRF